MKEREGKMQGKGGRGRKKGKQRGEKEGKERWSPEKFSTFEVPTEEDEPEKKIRKSSQKGGGWGRGIRIYYHRIILMT